MFRLCAGSRISGAASTRLVPEPPLGCERQCCVSSCEQIAKIIRQIEETSCCWWGLAWRRDSRHGGKK